MTRMPRVVKTPATLPDSLQKLLPPFCCCEELVELGGPVGVRVTVRSSPVTVCTLTIGVGDQEEVVVSREDRVVATAAVLEVVLLVKVEDGSEEGELVVSARVDGVGV
jgi:hypothetical protein